MLTRSDSAALIASTLLGEAAETWPIALFLHDPEGRIVATNAAAATLTGFRRSALVGLSFADLNGSPAYGERLRARLAAGTSLELTTIAHRDGRTLVIGLSGGPVSVAGVPYVLVAAWPC